VDQCALGQFSFSRLNRADHLPALRYADDTILLDAGFDNGIDNRADASGINANLVHFAAAVNLSGNLSDRENVIANRLD